MTCAYVDLSLAWLNFDWSARGRELTSCLLTFWRETTNKVEHLLLATSPRSNNSDLMFRRFWSWELWQSSMRQWRTMRQTALAGAARLQAQQTASTKAQDTA